MHCCVYTPTDNKTVEMSVCYGNFVMKLLPASLSGHQILSHLYDAKIAFVGFMQILRERKREMDTPWSWEFTDDLCLLLSELLDQSAESTGKEGF